MDVERIIVYILKRLYVATCTHGIELSDLEMMIVVANIKVCSTDCTMVVQ